MGRIASPEAIEPGTTAQGSDSPHPDAGLPDALRQSTNLVLAATLLVALIAASVLAGWAFDVEGLKRLLPNLTTMKANTALCFALTAAAMWLSRNRQSRAAYGIAVWMLTAVVIGMAAITLCEYAFGWNAGIDEFLFRDPEHLGTLSPPGRFAPASGIGFLLIGGVFLILDSWPRTSHGLILAAALVAMVGLIGYAYQLPTLYGAGRYTSLALHTILAFLALCFGLLASRPDRGITALLVESRVQGSSLMPLVLGAILLPGVLGAFTYWGQRRGLYGSEFTLALFSVLLMVLTLALVCITGAERQKVDARRLDAEKELQRLNLELETRVQQRTAELHASNRELETFSYSVSHDLRAPLRSMDSFSQFLLEDHADQLDDEAKSYLERIRVNAQRMGQLIADLLALSRLSRTELRRENVHLTALVLSVVEELRNRYPDREVEVDVAPGIHAKGDQRLLRVVLDNLLGNAWKFTSKKTAARIAFGRIASDRIASDPIASEKMHGEESVFFVRDNGAGFDMNYANQLFQPFQRLHQATEFEGTGIGLATVQRVIARHHGRIWAEGQVNQGATFFFSLGENGAGEKTIMPKNTFILLAEDNPDDEMITLRALRKSKVVNRIEVARDGAEALDFLFGSGAFAGRDLLDQPQLILLDVKLPKVNGLEVLRRLRADERTRRIPVVMLTSSTEDIDKKSCYDLGANSFISKPVEFGEFAEAVRNLGIYWLVLNQSAPD